MCICSVDIEGPGSSRRTNAISESNGIMKMKPSLKPPIRPFTQHTLAFSHLSSSLSHHCYTQHAIPGSAILPTVSAPASDRALVVIGPWIGLQQLKRETAGSACTHKSSHGEACRHEEGRRRCGWRRSSCSETACGYVLRGDRSDYAVLSTGVHSHTHHRDAVKRPNTTMLVDQLTQAPVHE